MISRPRTINIAAVIALVSLWVGPVKAVIEIPDINQLRDTLIGLFIFIALLSIPIFFFWKGVNWCRVIFSGLVVIGLIPYFQIIHQDLNTNIFLGVLSLIQAALQVCVIIFLYLPVSNTWYSEIRAAKNA
jgi:hypothetical protein